MKFLQKQIKHSVSLFLERKCKGNFKSRNFKSMYVTLRKKKNGFQTHTKDAQS